MFQRIGVLILAWLLFAVTLAACFGSGDYKLGFIVALSVPGVVILFLFLFHFLNKKLAPAKQQHVFFLFFNSPFIQVLGLDGIFDDSTTTRSPMERSCATFLDAFYFPDF